MAEKKQKKAKAEKKSRKSFLSKTRTLDPKKKKGMKNSSKSERKRGPELPSSLRKELNRLNPNPRSPDAGSDSDAAEPERPADLYEYVEPLPQEESKKNRRFDPVDNYEFELPEDFKDENIPSDDDEEELPSDDDDDDDDGDRHLRMLEGVTGMPGEAFEGKKRKPVVFSDGLIGNYPEITIADLLDDYPGLPGSSKLRKQMLIEHQSVPLQAPLPTVEQQRIERKVTYEKSKKNITKWEPLVKRNRELPTLYFQEDVDLGFSTVGAIASEFEPRTEFEKKMAMLVRDPDITEAHWKDGAKLLELNKIPVEDVRDRHNRLAKMRSLLFRHEMKAKHIKKIKSKAYHRILKKEKLKTASAEMQMNPEAAKEYAMKQEFKRAEERLTLKHKNSSKWARRIMERGLSVQDEGTQAAISEQLHQHALLTRKMNSMRDSDSSGTDDSSDDDVDEELSHATRTGGVSMILNRAKEKTIEVIEEEDEIPKSGVLALSFMERGLKKQKEAAFEEARLAIQEFDSSLRQLEDGNEAECPTSDKTSGRKVFGADREKSKKSNRRTKSENIGNNSDTEDEREDKEHEDVIHEAAPLEDVNIGWALQDESQMGQEPIYKSFEDIVENPGPKTTHEVAIFVSDSWKKMKGESAIDGRARETSAAGNPVLPRCDLKGTEQNSDSESDEDMVDGVLSSGAKLDYELPSQADLIHRAFAGDDVEAQFEKDKMDVLNEENPEPEKPRSLPGWGQWTHIQQKKGTPSRMLDEHEKAKRKREEALHKRKDAQLKHVIISEKIDRKAEKLHAKTLPFPYTSKEVYEQSIRMPIGPEYNPAISVGALNRPAVVKKAGVIIKPIKYEDVDPYKREDEPQRSRQKPKMKKTKSAGGKMVKKASGEKRS